MQRHLSHVRKRSQRWTLQLPGGARCALGRVAESASERLNRLTEQLSPSHGGSQKTYLQTEEARAQYTQAGGRDCSAEVSQVRRDEASASCLRRVRILRRSSGGRGTGSLSI